jgi:AcrR family transcriptional regulator
MADQKRESVRRADPGETTSGVMSAVVRTELPTTAQRILVAAQRVLLRDGYEALSLKRIADEALQTKSLVLYHFGSRANLEALLIDSLWHDIDSEFVASLAGLPSDTASRVDALVGFHARIAADPRRYQMYFDLLPSVIGERNLRANVARIYDAYREDINEQCLRDCEIPVEDLKPLAGLFLAVGEGLPLQVLMNPDEVDGETAFSRFATLVKNRYGGHPSAGESDFSPNERQAEGTALPLRTDPASDLPKPARRILKGALTLLQSGLRSITLDALAELSGEPRSSVSYYFRSKQGLIEVLFDAVLYRYRRAYVRLLDPPEGTALSAERVQHLMFGRESPSKAFFLILPAVLQDGALRQKAAAFHLDVRQALTRRLAGTSLHVSHVDALASVAIAALDGLAIQRLYDPSRFDPLPPLERLVSLVRQTESLTMSSMD